MRSGVYVKCGKSGGGSPLSGKEAKADGDCKFRSRRDTQGLLPPRSGGDRHPTNLRSSRKHVFCETNPISCGARGAGNPPMAHVVILRLRVLRASVVRPSPSQRCTPGPRRSASRATGLMDGLRCATAQTCFLRNEPNFPLPSEDPCARCTLQNINRRRPLAPPPDHRRHPASPRSKRRIPRRLRGSGVHVKTRRLSAPGVTRRGLPSRNSAGKCRFQGIDGGFRLSSKAFEGSFHVASEATGVSGLSERYANALFELADDRKVLDEVAGDLRALRTLMDESADFRRLIRSPVLSRAEQAKAVAAIAEKAGFSQLTRNFLGVVARNRRLFVLPGVISGYLSVLAVRRGEVTAEVTAAQAADAGPDGSRQRAAAQGGRQQGRGRPARRSQPDRRPHRQGGLAHGGCIDQEQAQPIAACDEGGSVNGNPRGGNLRHPEAADRRFRHRGRRRRGRPGPLGR